MYVPNGTSRGDADLRQWQGGVEKKLEVLLRRTNDRVKIPDPVVSSGGFVAQVEVQADAGFAPDPGVKLDPGTGIAWASQTLVAGTDASWLALGSPAAHQITVPEGWYSIVTLVEMYWNSTDDAGDGFRLYRGGSDDSATLNADVFPVTRVGGALWGLSRNVVEGPAYVKRPIDYQLLSDGKAPAALPVYSSLVVVITKYA